MTPNQPKPTPRTDAAIQSAVIEEVLTSFVRPAFARTLEIELTEAKTALVELSNMVLDSRQNVGKPMMMKASECLKLSKPADQPPN